MTLIKYMGTMRRYGYYVSTSPTAYQKDHFFCFNRGSLYFVLCPTYLVHSRKQIERMTADDLEGELIAKLFVL